MKSPEELGYKTPLWTCARLGAPSSRMSSASNITLAMSGRSSTISAGVANAQREEPAGGTRGPDDLSFQSRDRVGTRVAGHLRPVMPVASRYREDSISLRRLRRLRRLPFRVASGSVSGASTRAFVWPKSLPPSCALILSMLEEDHGQVQWIVVKDVEDLAFGRVPPRIHLSNSLSLAKL